MPSVVTVQLGQCGIQAGGSLFELLSNDLHNRKADEDTWNDFFREPLTPNSFPTSRSVLIDMEPKVIEQTVKLSRKFQYDPQSQYFKQSGSGNNWAYGFNVHGPSSWQDGVRDIIRKEVEKCDWFGGFLLMQSLGGGTGSGVGSFVTQQIRDEYTNSFILNQVVWPYTTGEVIVQNYNTLLSLCQLHEASDALLFFENDHLNRACNQLLSIAHPSFGDLNSVIASQLGSIFMPSYKLTDGKKVSLLYDVVRHLCSHPSYKILTSVTTPQVSNKSKAFSNHSWTGILKSSYQMLITDAKIDASINWKESLESDSFKLNSVLSSMVFLRGSGISSIPESSISPFRNPAIYTGYQDPFMLCKDENMYNNLDKSCCILSNSQSVIPPMDRMLSKASEMYHAGAYIYQYEKHGVDKQYFEYCFQQLEYVLHNYQLLSTKL
jgi:tubulin delta